MGLGERIAGSVPGGVLPLLLTGVHGGHDVDLRRLAKDGVMLVGGLRGVDARRLFFAPDLEANLAKGDEGVLGFTRLVHEFVAKHELTVPEDPQVSPTSMAATSSTADLDLRAAGITSVIWATGYRYDFSWIKCPVLNEDGKPVHHRGVTSVAGVCFLRLPLLHKIKSSFLWGVGDDASILPSTSWPGIRSVAASMPLHLSPGLAPAVAWSASGERQRRVATA